MPEQQTVEESQARLLHRVAAGDLEAVGEFYDQTAGPLLSVAFRILGDHGEAEEVIQDVFVQICEKAGSFDSTLGSAFHWAMSIARHRSIDRLRARQRRARLVDDLQVAAVPDPAPITIPDQGALNAEEVAAVRSALNNLPGEQRRVIELAFFAGKTHLEIAEALQEPLGTIKARIRRGLLKLHETLQACA